MTTVGPEGTRAPYFPDLETEIILKDPMRILWLAKGLTSRHDQLSPADSAETTLSADMLDHLHRIRTEIQISEAELLASINRMWRWVDEKISQVPMPDDEGVETEPRMRQVEIPPESYRPMTPGGTTSITETRGPDSNVAIVTYEHFSPGYGTTPKTIMLDFETREANRASLQKFKLEELTESVLGANRIRKVTVSFPPHGRFLVNWEESTNGGFVSQLPAAVPA